MKDAILTSESKARYIDEQLFDVVGQQPFWMDTITVNQRDQAEVIATVQAIPDIFRDAEKTIAIREGDGYYRRCVKAANGCKTHEEMQTKLVDHVEEHSYDVLDESYLNRLWTLQECLLSHTIQFVTCGSGSPVKREEGRDEAFDPYRYRGHALKSYDSLYCLSVGFNISNPNNDPDLLEQFIRAYLENGTVKREKRSLKTMEENIFSDNFVNLFESSPRSATMPRDYIFATMPQFPWYRYPASAEKMSLGEIFNNLFDQAAASGNAFFPRLTRSMTDPTATLTREMAWRPSTDQPEPRCLGDFFKLLAQNAKSPTSNVDSPIHFCTVVEARLAPCNPSLPVKPLLWVIESAIRFAPIVWMCSLRAGEVSAHGCYPESSSPWLARPSCHKRAVGKRV